MRRHPYLVQRRRTFFLRLRVPVDLVSLLRQTHVVRTLETTCAREAKMRAGERASSILRGFEEVRRVTKTLTITSLDELAALSDDEIFTISASAAELMPRPVRSALLKRMQEVCQTEERMDIADREKIERQRSDIQEMRSLMGALRQNEIQKLTLDAGRLQLEVLNRNLTGTVAPSTRPAGSKLAKGAAKPFHAHIKAYFAENAESIGASAQKSYEKAFDRLKSVVGEKPIRDIDRNDIVTFRTDLLKADGAKHGKERLSRPTIQKNLSHLKSFFRWAVMVNLIAENPAQEVMPPKEGKMAKGQPKRLPYTSEQLALIFDAPLFTGCKSPNRVLEPGSYLCRDGRYWMPLVALLTGARLGELEQMRAADVYEKQGIWYFDINVQADGDDEDEVVQTKSVKTANAIRVVPVHPVLVKLGFLTYHTERRKGGSDAALFDVSRYGRFWNEKFLMKIGIKNPLLVFHSFRHNYKQMIRTSIANVEVQNRLMGHAPRTTGELYGQGLQPDEAQLFCEKTQPQVDLTHLYCFH